MVTLETNENDGQKTRRFEDKHRNNVLHDSTGNDRWYEIKRSLCQNAMLL